jgi:hypothetical protein
MLVGIMSSPYLPHPSGPSLLDVLDPSRSRLVLCPFTEAEEHATEGGIILPGFPQGDKRRGLLPCLEVMEPPANRLIDLIKAHYPAYEKRTPLPDYVRHAMQMIQYCHTDALGGHVERCPDGHISRVFYNSCGHRVCPRCAGRQRRQWLRERRAKNLPVRHYHVVFTIPHGFNDLWRANPGRMGDILFHSATGALRALLADPKWLGAEPGMTITLETWDDRLCFHPHLHCLVTGGGLTPAGTWVDVPNPRCFVAVKPLMVEFRKRFCQAVKHILEHEQETHGKHHTQETFSLPEGTSPRQWLNRLHKVNRQDWEVFIAKPPEDGGPPTEEIEEYLAEDIAGGPLSAIRLGAPLSDPQPDLDLTRAQIAYLKSAPMSKSRLENTQEQAGQITFRWGVYDPETGKRERDRTETLSAAEFLSRYVQHIPPPNYQTVRHYGLYTSAQKEAYTRCCHLLSDRTPESLTLGSDDEVANAGPTDTDTWIQQHTCPVCGQPLIVSSYLPSSVTGRYLPRVPIGHVFVPSPSLEGGHDP